MPKQLRTIVLIVLGCTLATAFKFGHNLSNYSGPPDNHNVVQQIKENSQQANYLYTQFQAHYPDDKIGTSAIYLRGDNCNLTWSKGVSMKKVNVNKWAVNLLCPSTQIINVKVLLNDKIWMIGPNQVAFFNQSIIVDIYPSFSSAINPIKDTKQIYSEKLNNYRKLSIYYPPSFYQNPLKKYQLLLLHDGQNLFDPQKAAFGVAWKCQDTVNQLIFTGAIKQIIIVGIWNTPQRNTQYTYSYDKSEKFGGKGDQYLDFIEQEVIPLLKSTLLKDRIIDDDRISIGGSSLGGLISCYAAYTRSSLYKKAICMSSSFWWNNEDFNNQILKPQKYADSIFYLDSGDSGPSKDSKNETVRVFQNMKSMKYEQNQTLFYYLDKGGQHNEYFWGKRFSVPMIKLFGPTINH